MKGYLFNINSILETRAEKFNYLVEKFYTEVIVEKIIEKESLGIYDFNVKESDIPDEAIHKRPRQYRLNFLQKLAELIKEQGFSVNEINAGCIQISWDNEKS